MADLAKMLLQPRCWLLAKLCWLLPFTPRSCPWPSANARTHSHPTTQLSFCRSRTTFFLPLCEGKGQGGTEELSGWAVAVVLVTEQDSVAPSTCPQASLCACRPAGGCWSPLLGQETRGSPSAPPQCCYQVTGSNLPPLSKSKSNLFLTLRVFQHWAKYMTNRCLAGNHFHLCCTHNFLTSFHSKQADCYFEWKMEYLWGNLQADG